MAYQNPDIARVADTLKSVFESLDDKRAIMRSLELGSLYDQLKTLPPDQKAGFGKEVNELKNELQSWVDSVVETADEHPSIDITAPFDINVAVKDQPVLLPASQGTIHPLMSEVEHIIGILSRMGFSVYESREIDDDYHMFTSLNFPADHPARDDYDTFVTDEGLIAPAHTSTMQNRILRAGKNDLVKNDLPIAAVIPDRVFRNEDLDARHEHTFYQLEGIYVDHGVSTAHLIAVLKSWLGAYFEKDIKVKLQPFYFPFTEPSFEFVASCVFCNQKGCNICSQSGWIELGGCGMIHPNVLKEADIDPAAYSGFAWGFGIERLVMLKHDIEDVRYFHSANLKFLRQFK